jgi:hypothetical protein
VAIVVAAVVALDSTDLWIVGVIELIGDNATAHSQVKKSDRMWRAAHCVDDIGSVIREQQIGGERARQRGSNSDGALTTMFLRSCRDKSRVDWFCL